MTNPAADAASASAAPAPRLSVDRLVLHVPPMSRQDAERLAELIGQALRDWPTAPSASGRIAGVGVTVPAASPAGQASATPETLAAGIAEAILAAALQELS